MTTEYEEIRDKLRNDNIILFIGAGLPAALGLPTWGKLIDEIAEMLGYDPDVFKCSGDYLSLAEFFQLVKENDWKQELKKWMNKSFTVSDDKVSDAPAYQALAKLNAKLIYTTNYDHSIETALRLQGKTYKRIVNTDDLVNISADAVQVVKFHGDMDKMDSIVLSESNYFDRLDFSSPLDIRLRSDMLGKSILFIGYSLSDINMRFLLYKLDQLWKGSNHLGQRPKSYIFLAHPDPIQEKIFQKRGIIPIVGSDTNEGKNLSQFLEKIKP